MVEEAVLQDRGAYRSAEIALNTDIPLASLDLESAVEKLNVNRKLYDLATDLRWLKRRLIYVRDILTSMIYLFPERFGNCVPSIASFRSVLGDDSVLVQLREIAEPELYKISKPVGLNPRAPPPQDTAWLPP